MISIKRVFKKSKKLTIKIIIKFIVFSIIAYIVFLFINQQVKIWQTNDEYNSKNEKIKIEKQKKDELIKAIEGNEEEENNHDSSKVRIFENVME
ncbi:MAG: hypothetical protein IJG00_05840 [Clostridia bacterium]|nr:hypothetical protein [Clostridia bacterium]